MPGVPPGAGWLRDLPDFRDLTPTTPAVRDAFARLKRRRAPRGSPRPAAVAYREFIGSPRSLASLRAGATQAVLGLVELCERRAHGRVFDGSAVFLYQAARRLAGTTGDNGIGLRWALMALARFGCPPVRHWPDEPAKFDNEPDAFAYGFQKEFAELQYVRLDPPGTPQADVLQTIRALLSAGFPCVGGFSIPGSLDRTGDIAYPTRHDAVDDGAAALIVGYDDDYRIRSTKGALMIRGTFGPDWGEAGFGRLPYRFIETGLACDFWTVLRPDWLASGEFVQPDLKHA